MSINEHITSFPVHDVVGLLHMMNLLQELREEEKHAETRGKGSKGAQTQRRTFSRLRGRNGYLKL
eukprot:TRINITY_DN9778_c0_g1_i1.p1 TRINITY_DN9778_c0_g1~~TRINITY_DN9778_c0_g1_i1.p1  ORF type:complete len:65 (-),score=9.14 TRINITY_DN9778_c0_g1_i1:259-453(-)